MEKSVNWSIFRSWIRDSEVHKFWASIGSVGVVRVWLISVIEWSRCASCRAPNSATVGRLCSDWSCTWPPALSVCCAHLTDLRDHPITKRPLIICLAMANTAVDRQQQSPKQPPIAQDWAFAIDQLLRRWAIHQRWSNAHNVDIIDNSLKYWQHRCIVDVGSTWCPLCMNRCGLPWWHWSVLMRRSMYCRSEWWSQ